MRDDRKIYMVWNKPSTEFVTKGRRYEILDSAPLGDNEFIYSFTNDKKQLDRARSVCFRISSRPATYGRSKVKPKKTIL